MKRQISQRLRDLYQFREEGGDDGGMRTDRRKCPCAWQSGNTHNSAFNTAYCAMYLNPLEDRKTFRGSRLSSKLEARRVTGSVNLCTVGSKERNSCSAKSVRQSIDQTKRCRHA
jgi:hypothetical protein